MNFKQHDKDEAILRRQ